MEKELTFTIGKGKDDERLERFRRSCSIGALRGRTHNVGHDDSHQKAVAHNRRPGRRSGGGSVMATPSKVYYPLADAVGQKVEIRKPPNMYGHGFHVQGTLTKGFATKIWAVYRDDSNEAGVLFHEKSVRDIRTGFKLLEIILDA
jgi:hypothetical protein